VAVTLRNRHPNAPELLKTAAEAILAFMQVPPEHRRSSAFPGRRSATGGSPVASKFSTNG